MGSTLSTPAPMTGGLAPSLGAWSRIADRLRPYLATALDLLLLVVLATLMAVAVVWAFSVATLPDSGYYDCCFYSTGDLV